MRKKEIQLKLSSRHTIIKLDKKLLCWKYYFKVLILMRDDTCFSQEAKVINESWYDDVVLKGSWGSVTVWERLESAPKLGCICMLRNFYWSPGCIWVERSDYYVSELIVGNTKEVCLFNWLNVTIFFLH